jgi:hypothetical protein
MAVPFEVQLSMSEAPSEAQARAAEALADPAHRVGLRLTKRDAGVLTYRPRMQFPLALMLWRAVTGERMTVRFEPGEEGGAQVEISGAVGRGRQPLAADPEHWAEALGATPSDAV